MRLQRGIQKQPTETETEHKDRQIAAENYTRGWDFFWLPIRFVADQFLTHKWLPQFGPWLIAARVGRWPQKLNYNQYRICRDAECETCRSLQPDQMEIDDDNEIKHDPFLADQC